MAEEKWKVKKVSEYLTPDEVRRIIEAIPKERDTLIFRVLWETGARISEVLSITRGYIDQEKNYLYLRNLKQQRRKSLSSPRLPALLKRVFLSADSTLCRDLTSYCDRCGVGADDLIFRGNSRRPGREGQVSPSYIWKLVAQRGKGVAWELGIRRKKKDPTSGNEEPKAAWPHLFRHSTAMELLKQTGRLEIVKEQLGHSSVRTTEIYAGITDEERRKTMEKVKMG